MTSSSRTPQYPVDEQFVQRWSPRAFAPVEIEEETLLGFIEAARWAPSAFNAQPWRFLYARRGDAHWELFLSLLAEFNRGWAQHASALVIILSKTTHTRAGSGEEVPFPSHSFDAGAAWAYLALQATNAGWHAHGMAGIDREGIQHELKVPAAFKVELAVAIGKLGDKASLPESLQGRELPSPRLTIEELAVAGPYTLG
ncbi:nitroreductase family protein [uncultured Pseudomonas sp.]|uniref:nitroreductase family protein n=1 Tax=uncultured Pseudomonas sp. TaxID=114707 RepID=UPI0025CD4864|nr:nitroreductase family protein [uncultured Pseudomonas sp.]